MDDRYAQTQGLGLNALSSERRCILIRGCNSSFLAPVLSCQASRGVQAHAQYRFHDGHPCCVVSLHIHI